MLCKMYKKTVPTKRGNNKPLSTTGDMLPKCKQVTLLRAAVRVHLTGNAKGGWKLVLWLHGRRALL